MTDNVEKRRGRRGRWLVLALLVGVAGWVVRSRMAAADDIGTGWPTPRPAGAGAQYLLPPGPPPTESSLAPAAVATAQAAPAARRPSPRPRTPVATESTPREH
jgi:hypothetical protein